MVAGKENQNRKQKILKSKREEDIKSKRKKDY